MAKREHNSVRLQSYLGSDRFVQAPASKGVHIEKLSTPYYVKRFLGIARFLLSQPGLAGAASTREFVPHRPQDKELKAEQP